MILYSARIFVAVQTPPTAAEAVGLRTWLVWAGGRAAPAGVELNVTGGTAPQKPLPTIVHPNVAGRHAPAPVLVIV